MTGLYKKIASSVCALAMLSGCATGVSIPTQDAKLVQGPPISDIVTPFDQALSCLNGRVAKNIVFSVGAILDQTGKETFNDGGVGKFVTQGAGDMVQSALFKAGTTIVNRRDPRVTTTEIEWRIRDNRNIIPTSYYITGSINSLDFIPGSGAQVDVAGVGAKYRQHRMLVGIDLALTDARTGRIVANVPLHKQIFASEFGAGTGRFFGNTLVMADIGGREREALHFALRQMLYLATFELLTQVMNVKNYADCRSHIDDEHGRIEATNTAKAVAALEAHNTRTQAAHQTVSSASPPAQVIANQPAAQSSRQQVASTPAKQTAQSNTNKQNSSVATTKPQATASQKPVATAQVQRSQASKNADVQRAALQPANQQEVRASTAPQTTTTQNPQQTASIPSTQRQKQAAVNPQRFATEPSNRTVASADNGGTQLKWDEASKSWVPK